MTTKKNLNDMIEIVDASGRTVEVKQNIKKVYASDPVGKLIVKTFEDRLLVGLNFKLSKEEKNIHHNTIKSYLF